jgi:proton-translocating NADH-quinone oxidoreductase chain N
MLTNSRDDFQLLLDTEFKTFLFENDYKAILPELFLILAGILLLVYGVLLTTSKERNYPVLVTNTLWLGQLSLLLTFALLCNAPFRNGMLFYNSLVLDDFTLFLKALLLIGAFFSLLISVDYINSVSLNSFEYIVLVLFSTSSMLLLISSADFISMYLAIELQSLCFYVMAALKRNSEFSTEAGLKYFLLGAFSSGILLFGCSLIYGFTGVTNFSELAQIFTSGSEELLLGGNSLQGCELGMIFLLVGFLFKLTAVPFHMWAPDVYEGAPTAVTAFFSIVPKISLFAVFIRLFFESFYDLMLPWQKILLFCSIASMLLASLAAMSQNKIKRLLAFSSIGHVGYLLVGFCCGTVEGLQALILYLVVYVVMTINLFTFVLSPVRRDGEKEVRRVKYTTDLAALSRTNPILALTLTLTLFSIAGIPPLAGFYSKAYLLFAALSSSQYLLAVVAILTSVISCFYYIRLVKIMYFESPKRWLTFYQLPKENSIALGITSLFLTLFILYPTPLYLISHKIALTLCL